MQSTISKEDDDDTLPLSDSSIGYDETHHGKNIYAHPGKVCLSHDHYLDPAQPVSDLAVGGWPP